MKLPEVVVLAKCLCYVVIGGLTPLISGLSQWANSGTWPDRITWVTTLAGCGVGAATQLLSFLSSAYSDYKQQRVAGDTQRIVKTP